MNEPADFIGIVVAISLGTLIASRARTRSLVAAASGCEAIVTCGWALIMGVAATPCALSGSGILEATPQCSVQATHIVSAILGGTSSLALLIGSVAGFLYAAGGQDRHRRGFRIALVAAALLILVWLVSDLVLPRHHPMD